MGVFYEVRVHVAEYQDDYKGRKGSSTSMGIRKVSRRTFREFLTNLIFLVPIFLQPDCVNL